MSRTTRFALLAIAAFAPAVAVAQTAATLDAGATRISYADGDGVTGLSITPGIQLIRPWRSLAASASWSRFDEGVWSVQGHAAGSSYFAPIGGLRPELELVGGGTRHQDGGSSGEIDGALRLHRLGEPLGFWAGILGGRAYNGAEWRSRLSGEAGVWARVGPGLVTFTLSASRINGELDYGEAEAAYRVDRGRLELVAYGGLRHWLNPDASANGWAGATAAVWLNDRVALTLAGGAYPANYAQGLPDGSFGAIGVRLATGRVARARRLYDPLDLLIPLPLAPNAPAFTYHRTGSGELAFTLRNVSASSVEVMGDFTGWQPVALALDGDGAWTVTLPVKPGLHRLNLRTDGGAWIAPPGMTAVSDEFGGPTAVIVVE